MLFMFVDMCECVCVCVCVCVCPFLPSQSHNFIIAFEDTSESRDISPGCVVKSQSRVHGIKKV